MACVSSEVGLVCAGGYGEVGCSDGACGDYAAVAVDVYAGEGVVGACAAEEGREEQVGAVGGELEDECVAVAALE